MGSTLYRHVFVMALEKGLSNWVFWPSFTLGERAGGGGVLLPIYGIAQMCMPNGPLFQHCQVYD